jgi:DNA polymerase-3 subunit alpha
VLFIAQAFAGYSLGQADIFRKAMGKKIPEVMRKEKRNFITGANGNGFSAEVASEVFALIEPFAGYAFNKAHSVSYALVAYHTAYLKANYPVEYITAFLLTNTGQSEKVSSAIAECRRLDITVLPPDINRSQANFSIEKDSKDNAPTIRFGLATIKNVGLGAIEPIIAERNKEGEFKSIEDLCHRCALRSINKRVLESLIKVGALDCLGSRGTLLHNSNRILSLAQREQRLRETGQSTMFDLWGKTMPIPMPSLDLETADISINEQLAWERELMGVYFSEHPLSVVTAKATLENTTLCGQIDVELVGQTVVVAGMVASVRSLFTRDRRPFVSAVLEDLDGRIEAMVWPKLYSDTKDLWQEGNILLVEGKVRLRDDRVQLNCDHVRRYQLEAAQGKEIVTPQPTKAPIVAETVTAYTAPAESRRLVIDISQTSDKDTDIAYLHKLINTLKEFPGQNTVSLRVTNEEKIINLKLSSIRTGYCPELHQRLVELVGEDGIRVEPI